MTRVFLNNLNQPAASINSINGKKAPKARKKYGGSILFAHGQYGDITVIQSDFGKLPVSEPFYTHQKDFVESIITNDMQMKQDFGTVYLFDGYYRMFKNGRGRFVGDITKVG